MIAVVALLIGASGTAWPQEITGAISITVRDATGGAVRGATITVTDTATKQVVRTATTNEDGAYAARDIHAQLYDVAVEATGFKKKVLSRVQVDVGRHTNLFIALEVGAISQVVKVEAKPVAVELSTPTVSTIINGNQARELSLNNRNWVQLITLSPGVSSDLADQVYVGTTNPVGAAGVAGQANTMNISVNGARSSQNTYTVDGADVTDRGSNITIQTYPSVDSISEFSVKRGLFTADSGRSGGGQINVVTRSGGNEFHGSIFEFLRNDKLNANDFLSNSLASPAFGREANGKAKRAPFRYNNFGGTIGGPVYTPHFGEGGKLWSKPPRTYFFFSEELRRDRRYPILSATVPDANMRNGIFPMDICLSAFAATVSPPAINPGNCTNVLPAGTPMSSKVAVNPVAQQYLDLIYKNMPLPTNSVTGGLLGPALNVADFRQEILRLDHTFNDSVSMFYRFEHDTIPTTDVNSIFSAGSRIPGVSTSETQSPGKTHTAQVTYLPKSSLVIAGRWSYGYGAVVSNTTGTLGLAQSPIAPPMAFPVRRDLVPQIGNAASTNGFSNLVAFGNYDNFSYKHNFAGDITWTKGAHTFKFGNQFSYYRKDENALAGVNQGMFSDFRNTTVDSLQQASVTAPNAALQVTNPTQRANYQLFANFLLGNNVTFTQSHFDFVADMRQIAVEPYAQDEWRVRPNLTLYYGVRYSYFGSPYDRNGHLSNFDPRLWNPAAAPQVAGNGTRIDGTGNFCNGMIVNAQNLQTAPNCTPTVSPYGKYVVKAPKNDFAPRFGIAWDPFGKGQTSIRTGYGIYYDQVLNGTYEQNIGTNPPYQETVTQTLTRLDQPVPPGTNVTAGSINSIRGIQPNWKDPYMQHWSLEWQQMLGAKTLVSAGYFGSKGTHLIGSYELNELPPGYALTQKCVPVTSGNTLQTPGVTTVPCQAPGAYFGGNGQSSTILDQIRPYRGYRSINLITPQFNSNYHSLQVLGQRRFDGSSQVNVAYTWAKNLSDNPTDRATAPENSYNISGDRGRAALDRRHIFTANYIYEVHWFHKRHGVVGQLLEGWELSGIVTIQTGLPFTLTTNFDAAGLGNVPALVAGNRPNLLCDPNQNAPQTQQQYFNTSCVQANPASAATIVANVPGNAARGVLNGPPTERVDFSLFKSFRFGEGDTRLQLRAEFFNVLNHTNFRTIQTSTTAGTFGQVIAVRDPRTIQIGAKLMF